MKSNREIRAEAWELLRRTPWGWRVLGVGGFVGIVSSLGLNVIASGLENAGVQTWQDFNLAAIRARWSGLALTIPSLRVAAYMTGASVLTYFIEKIFAGIQLFALSSVTLRAVMAGDAKDWFMPAMEGFKRPFGMFFLTFCWLLRILWFIYLGWFVIGVGVGIFTGMRLISTSALIAVAVVVACLGIALIVVGCYRYRFVWFVKIAYPDWGANRCLNEARQLMEGWKWKAFLLDCSYWRLITLWLAGALLFMVLFVCAQFFASLVDVLGLLMFFVFLFLAAFGIYLALYLNFGQAVFYRELLAGAMPKPTESAPEADEREAV